MHQINIGEDGLVTVRASGTLTQEDYDALLPAWEKAITQSGALRLLWLLEDFHGWSPTAAWDDFRFESKHAAQVQRVALVGEKAWQKWMTKIGSFFMRESVRYFDAAEQAEAERWVRAG